MMKAWEQKQSGKSPEILAEIKRLDEESADMLKRVRELV